MNTAALLSNPIIATMSPEEVFHLLKKSEALMQLKQRVTKSRAGQPMLACFAELADLDASIDIGRCD